MPSLCPSTLTVIQIQINGSYPCLDATLRDIGFTKVLDPPSSVQNKLGPSSVGTLTQRLKEVSAYLGTYLSRVASTVG